MQAEMSLLLDKADTRSRLQFRNDRAVEYKE